MAQIDLIENSWSDIMFENRNKEYGAYVLRRQTGRRNVLSMIFILIFLAIVSGLYIAKSAYDEYEKEQKRLADLQAAELSALQEEQIEEKEEEVKVEREEPVKQEEVQEVVQEVQSSVKFTAPVIKEDNQVKEENMLSSQDDLSKDDRAIGQLTVEGNSDHGAILQVKQAVVGEEVAKPKPPVVEENKVLDVAEVMPSYPGGQGALMQFLSSHIKYPVIAEENGIQGRVICTFVVERDGSITDVKVAKSVDPSLDKEAVRVIKSMPKWIPGKQNGSAVRVKFTLPVTFRLQ